MPEYWDYQSPFPPDIGSTDPGAPLPANLPAEDWAAYWSMAPGGRFPGDEYFWREVQRALENPEAHAANPEYDLPDWLTGNRGLLGRLARMHETNVQQHGGVGGTSNPLAGGGGHLYSGPFASAGPPGGDLHGFIDRGNLGIFDFPESPGSTGVAAGGGGGGSGGGGRQPYSGPTGWGVPSAPNWSPSFVGWNPGGPPQMVYPQGREPVWTTPPPPKPPTAGSGPPRGSGGSGSGRGGGGGTSRPAGGGGGVPPKPGAASALSPELAALLNLLGGDGGNPAGGGTMREMLGTAGRGGDFAGYDVERILGDFVSDPLANELGSVGRIPGLGYQFSHLQPHYTLGSPPPSPGSLFGSYEPFNPGFGAGPGGGGMRGGDEPDWSMFHIPSAT